MAVKTTYLCDSTGCTSSTPNPVGWYHLSIRHEDEVTLLNIQHTGTIPRGGSLACGRQCLTTQLYRMIDQETQRRAQPAPEDTD